MATTKVLEKSSVTVTVTAFYSAFVCGSTPSLSIQTAACQPAEPMQGRGVRWGAGVSKVRAELARLHWVELKWMQEKASPASQGHRFAARKRRLLEQETQPDRTWKPRAAMTHDGHKRWKRSCLLLLLPSFLPMCSLSLTYGFAALRQDHWRRGGGRGGKEMALGSQWLPLELWPPL